MDSTRSLLRVAGVLAAAGLILGGCASNNNGELDAALMENQELRQRLADTESALADCQSGRAQLEGQSTNLAAELERLRNELSKTPNFGDGVTVSRRGSEIAVGVAGDVLFDSGSATLKTSAKSTLERIAQILNSQYASNAIRIEGHTDADPIKKSGWKTNERLSSERALAVEEFLVSKGVNNKRVYSAAFGPAIPRNSKNESRRVEIVILASASSGSGE